MRTNLMEGSGVCVACGAGGDDVALDEQTKKCASCTGGDTGGGDAPAEAPAEGGDAPAAE